MVNRGAGEGGMRDRIVRDATVPLPLPQAAMALEPAEARGARPGGAEARARFRVARFIMEAGKERGGGGGQGGPRRRVTSR